MERSLSLSLLVFATAVFALFIRQSSAVHSNVANLLRRSRDEETSSLCAQLIEPNGYACTEHTVLSSFLLLNRSFVLFTVVILSAKAMISA